MDLATLGEKQAQALTEVQKEWLSLFQQATDDRFTRTALE
jgi:hypothetical protein